jgi:ribosomal protein S18 acetylase RimI-like enzyme
VTDAPIRAATAAEFVDLGALIALAFHHLGPDTYVVPDPADRPRVMGQFFTMMVEHAARYGRVDVVARGGGPEAAAVWFDRTWDAPRTPDFEDRVAGFAGPYLDNFASLDLLEKHEPAEPHWHLHFMAVHPDSQNQGLASALMRRTHAALDAAGIPQYLEATNDDNIRLYRRHGYAPMDPFDIRLPDGTPFYRMWRPAGG